MGLDLNALKTELDTDPLLLGYAGTSNLAAVRLLNEPNRTFSKPLAFTDVMRWAAAEGTYSAIKDAAEEVTNSHSVRSICFISLEIMLSPHTNTLDVDDPEISGMLGALVASGVITAASRAALEARAIQTGSRAEELFDTSVSEIQVAAARNLP